MWRVCGQVRSYVKGYKKYVYYNINIYNKVKVKVILT